MLAHQVRTLILSYGIKGVRAEFHIMREQRALAKQGGAEGGRKEGRERKEEES